MTPKHSALRVSSVPKCKETVTSFTEKTLVLDKLCSGMSYGVRLSTKLMNEECILHKASLDRNTYKTRLYIKSVDKNVTTHNEEPNPIFPLGAQTQSLLIQYSWQLYRTHNYYE